MDEADSYPRLTALLQSHDALLLTREFSSRALQPQGEPGQSHRQLLEEVHDHWLHEASSLQVTPPIRWYSEGGFLYARGQIEYQGDPIGSYGYALGTDSSGDLLVHIDSITLDDDRQGLGFGRDYVREIERRYRERGVRYMTLNATGVGGYFWACEGFLFDPRQLAERPLSPDESDLFVIRSAQEVLGRARVFSELADDKRLGRSEIAALLASAPLEDDLEGDGIDNKLITPYRISQLGCERSWFENEEVALRRRNGELLKIATSCEMWLGKKLLLRCDWSGFKPL